MAKTDNEKWPSNVTRTHEIGSQRGAPYGGEAKSFDDEINVFLGLGWRIIATYIEGKGPESTREECVCLLGWTEQLGKPRYPVGCGDDSAM